MNACSRASSLLSLVGILAAALVGCRQGPSPAPPESLSTPATVTRGSMADVVLLPGQIVAQNARTLTFGAAAGRVLEVLVRPGQVVQKGAPLVRMETTEQERALREAQADLKVAEAVLADAQRTTTTAEMAKAQADLAAAEAEQAAAKVKLAVAERAGLAPLEEAVADAQVALRLAQDQLRQQEIGGNAGSIRTLEYQQAFFQRALRDLKPGEDPTELRQTLASVERELASARGTREDALRSARENVAKAEEQLAKARASLARAQAGEEDPVLSARLAYEQATQAVKRARQRIEELKAGADSAAVKAAKTSYEAAKARVESAQAAIAGANLTAPFDGVVFAVYAQADTRVQPTDKVVYIADPKSLRVQAQATEMDIGKLSVGQAVRVTTDAFPGRAFNGKVLSLPVRGKESGGLSTYTVETSLEQAGTDIRPGLVAYVRVVIGEKQDVLMVPAAAIQYLPAGEPYVQVQEAGGKARQQQVKIGLNDGIMVEVQEGLSEGQTVLVPLVPPMDPRQRNMMMGPGGGVIVVERG